MSSLPSRGRNIPDDRVRSMDDAAFDALVRVHYGRLCNFAVRLVESRDIAEDIVQDVFCRIWDRQTEFQQSDPLPYLYQAVRNRAANYVRSRRVRERWQQSTEQNEKGKGQSTTGADTVLEAAELAGAIARAVETLPDRCRLMFTMSREQDLTYPQIAAILGVSVKTVETQMGRALKTLRIKLAGYLTFVAFIVAGGRWLE